MIGVISLISFRKFCALSVSHRKCISLLCRAPPPPTLSTIAFKPFSRDACVEFTSALRKLRQLINADTVDDVTFDGHDLCVIALQEVPEEVEQLARDLGESFEGNLEQALVSLLLVRQSLPHMLKLAPSPQCDVPGCASGRISSISVMQLDPSVL